MRLVSFQIIALTQSCVVQLTIFPAFVLHENLEEPLDEEEKVDASPDDDGDFKVAVVRVEADITQGKGRGDEMKDGGTWKK